MPRISERFHANSIFFANQRESIFLLYTVSPWNFLGANNHFENSSRFLAVILILT